MNRLDLLFKLTELNIEPRRYSLYDELKPDAIILFHNYSKWEVFYLNERGGRNVEKIFDSEEKACEYILRLFIESKEDEKKYNIKL